jgi:hypothetical protein
MKAWRDMPLKTFFTIDGEVFQKNSATTALHVSNPMFGEIYITPMQVRAIQPYVPVPTAPPIQAPRDPEHFETKVVPRPETDPNFGATKITVTPADSKVEQGIQPPAGTGKRRVEPAAAKVEQLAIEQPPVQPPAGKRKKARKNSEASKPIIEEN